MFTAGVIRRTGRPECALVARVEWLRSTRVAGQGFWLRRWRLTIGGDAGQVIRSLDASQAGDQAPLARGPAGVCGELVAGDAGSVRRGAALLNRGDVVIVQHEYGVYGGPDGEEILQLMAALTVPCIVVLHTVLTVPTAHQKLVLETAAGLVDAVVVMTDTARDRLAAGYGVDMGKVTVIPHGAPSARAEFIPAIPHDRPTVLTWGLIGPGKGIEWGIQAMAALRDLRPLPRYVIAGRTHPKVLLGQGEAYRNHLIQQVRDLSLDRIITFQDRYLDAAALTELVESADVVLLAYDSTEQVTSGVLTEAVAAGKPVIATRFPHAVELLGSGAGMLVPHQDPAAIAAALRALLTHRELAIDMTRAAGAAVPGLRWSAVAARYRDLARHLISDRIAA